jgi:S-DNA-T family DNA segregation ATPase FtsK/SpoIIIE
MANKLKSKSAPKVSEEALNPDKEAALDVTEVVKDERTSKIIGLIFILVTLFLFVAFTSYLFTWQEDQDKVQLWRTSLFSTQDVKVNNQLGFIGAFIAYQIINNGFGLASYLFCTFTFVLGINMFFTKQIFSIWRNVRYVLVGLLVLSTCFAFVTKGSTFSWGGAVGEYSNSWLIKWVGTFGTGALLLVSDSPMVPEGVKTEASDSQVTAQFVKRHLTIGIESLKQLINNGQTVRHLQF